MDAPAIQDGRAPDLDPLDVIVPNGRFHEGERSKANCQSIALVLDRQVMEGQPDQGQQQSGSDHHRNDDRLFTGQPKRQRKTGWTIRTISEGGLRVESTARSFVLRSAVPGSS